MQMGGTASSAGHLVRGRGLEFVTPFEKKTMDVPLTPKSVGCSHLMRHTLSLFLDLSEDETEASTLVSLSLSSPVFTVASVAGRAPPLFSFWDSIPSLLLFSTNYSNNDIK